MENPWNNVRGFERFSLCDWPGHASCVLFLGGCAMKCPTCHNFTLAWEKESLPAIGQQHIQSYIKDKHKWLDGISITGGEPTETANLITLLTDLRQHGLPIKLDTNGMRPGIVQLLLEHELVDTFAVDVKGPFSKYPVLTGNVVSPDQAASNLLDIFQLAMLAPQSFYFRLTKVPVLSEADIEEARTYLPKGFDLTLQDFVPPRRTSHAQADSQTRRMPGDVVSGTDSRSNPQGPESQRN